MNSANLENLLTNLDSSSKLKRLFFCWLLAPITCIIEIICWFGIWRKIVVKSLIENDNIFEFFDKNEFVYRKWYHLSKFEKWDMVPPDNTYYAEIKDSEKLRQAIRKEYIDTFVDIIEKNSPFDLQNFISLQCKLDYKTIDGIIVRIYNISIQYWRHFMIKKSIYKTLIWLMSIGIIWFIINTIFAQIIG